MYSRNHDLAVKIGALALAAGLVFSGCSKNSKESTTRNTTSKAAYEAEPDEDRHSNLRNGGAEDAF